MLSRPEFVLEHDLCLWASKTCHTSRAHRRTQSSRLTTRSGSSSPAATNRQGRDTGENNPRWLGNRCQETVCAIRIGEVADQLAALVVVESRARAAAIVVLEVDVVQEIVAKAVGVSVLIDVRAGHDVVGRVVRVSCRGPRMRIIQSRYCPAGGVVDERGRAAH